MAFSYTILYFTKIDATPIYNYGSILGRILQNRLLISKYLVILILFKISKTSSIRIGYILLRIITLLLAIFRLLLLVQKNQYRRKLRLYINYRNLKTTYIFWKVILIYIKTPRTLTPYLELLSYLEVFSYLELLRLYLLYSS